jgi:hypothetical protein
MWNISEVVAKQLGVWENNTITVSVSGPNNVYNISKDRKSEQMKKIAVLRVATVQWKIHCVPSSFRVRRALF